MNRGVKITGVLPVTSRAISTEINEIWLVEVINSSESFGLLPDNVFEYTVKAEINIDGSFDIDTSDLPNNESDSFFILLLNTSLPDRKDHIVSYVSIEDGVNDNLISLPLADIEDDLDLGELDIEGEDAVSTKIDLVTLTELTNGNIDDFRLKAREDDRYKALLNQYLYYDSEDKEPLRVRMLFNFYSDFYNNLTIDSDSWSIGHFELWTIGLPYVAPYDSWTEEEYYSKVNLGYNSLFYGEVNFIAPDDSVIEAKIGNYIGPLYYINLNSAADIQDGFYKIEDSDTKEVLAEYNFSYESIYDSNGFPYIPMPEVSITKDGNIVESISTKWFSYDKNGNKSEVPFETLGFSEIAILFDDIENNSSAYLPIVSDINYIDKETAQMNNGFRILYRYQGIAFELVCGVYMN